MKAIIEIPKGDDRRRHLKYDKTGFVDLGQIKDVIPVNEGIMPVDYGYVPGTMNEKEGDEIDILIISDKKFKVGQEIEVEPVALIKRSDGDDKIIAVDETKKSIKKWLDIPKETRNLIESFFCHRNKIIAIEDAEKARQYVEENSV
jgi:inorganic pyrophosphatase